MARGSAIKGRANTARDSDVNWLSRTLRVSEGTVLRLLAASKSLDHALCKIEAHGGHLSPAKKGKVIQAIEHARSDADRISDDEALRRIRAAIGRTRGDEVIFDAAFNWSTIRSASTPVIRMP